MLFLREENFDCETLVEDTSTGVRNYYIKGPFLVAETPNKNRRLYPKAVLEREVNAYQSLIKERRALGELSHPETPNINLDRASHLITSLQFINGGNVAEGIAKVLDTPMGKIVKVFIEEKVRNGVSSRGVGSLKLSESQYNVVQDDYHLSTVDIVADPSAPGAFIEGIMENSSWVKDVVSGNWKLVESVRSDVKRAKKSQMEFVIVESFKKFVNGLV